MPHQRRISAGLCQFFRIAADPDSVRRWQTESLESMRTEVADVPTEQPDPFVELLSEECLEMIEKIQAYRERIQLPSTPTAILEDAIIEYYTALKRVGNW